MDPRKLAYLMLPLAVQLAYAAEMAPKSGNSAPTAIPGTNLAISPDATSLEEGKALYENGQMIAALGKFMGVLRSDPHNPEARQYLRLIVDTMRQNPSISSSKMGQEQALASNPAVQEEIRRMLQLRSRLTLDLKAIPSVQVDVTGNVNQVLIDTSLLFADKSGGLKEQGIPVLDRVTKWLKTYGQQPVIIHCYPEELQDPSTNDSLFIHRYSELFNFFVEEKKLLPQRFVSADLLKTSGGAGERGSGGEDISVSTTTSRVVIETIGTQTAMLEAMPSITSTKGISQWIENAIIPSRQTFNPEEGEWVNLDLAALTRAGLRNWTFAIVRAEGKNTSPVFQTDGKGNLLKRLSWDGHDQKGGSFVNAGSYVAKLVAVNSDGTIKTQEEILQVVRTTAPEPVALVNKPKPQPKPQAKPKPKPVQVAKAAVVSSPPNGTVGGPSSKDMMGSQPETAGNDGKKVDNPDSLIDAAPAAPVTPTAAPVVEDTADAAHTIWKQVIQYEPNQSELVPTVKSSLERIGKTLEVYPLQKVRIMGFAASSEQNALDLARKRAQTVRSILVHEYHVDAKRVIDAGGKISAEDIASKVEMSITN
jgi:outer membrane protein OmpA-like peptidoglycan-associated protein